MTLSRHNLALVMRMKSIMICLLPMLCAACSSTRNTTADPAGATDFVVGQTYRVKQRVMLYGGVLQRVWDKYLAERWGPAHLRGIDGPWVKGFVDPGTLLVVRKVEVMQARPPKAGPWTEVYAEILSATGRPTEPEPARKGGPAQVQKQNLVLVSEVSLRRPGGYTKRDPEILEAVE